LIHFYKRTFSEAFLKTYEDNHAFEG